MREMVDIDRMLMWVDEHWIRFACNYFTPCSLPISHIGDHSFIKKQI